MGDLFLRGYSILIWMCQCEGHALLATLVTLFSQGKGIHPLRYNNDILMHMTHRVSTITEEDSWRPLHHHW